LRRTNRIPPDEARRILIELADALDYAHTISVVHRDIKPDNVLIDRATGKAVLTDFGIAKTQAGGTQITRTGMIVGTPLYMSPEQAAGDKDVDGRTDIYSLGVIGYRMLTGRLPYEGDSVQELFIRQMSQPATEIDTTDGLIPEDLAAAVMRCLAREPAERWSSAATLRDALVAEALHPAERSPYAPPARWTGWWPARWRSRGDMWFRLPPEVRRARTLWSLATIAAPALLLTALVIGAAVNAGGGGSRTLVIGFGGAAIVWAFLMASAMSARTALANLMARQRVPGMYLRSVLRESTTNPRFWRDKEIARLFPGPASRAAKAGIDGSKEDDYCAVTLVHSGMFDHIDPRSPTPLYAQIASRLRVAIAAGELERGEALPSVRALASRLRINPATVVQAYRELETEGLVSTRHGAGTFVQDVAPDRKVRDRAAEARRLVRDLLAQAGSLGITSSELRSAVDEELKR
jgi:DNA-binding transcriptional regulator YhcF (GntR family)